jgi:hypothetical protein
VPLPQTFPFSVQTGKYQSLLDAAARENIDVVITGLSPMMRIRAARLERLLQEQSGTHVRVFNLAAPQVGSYFSRLLLERIVSRITKPRIVIHGVMPLDLFLEKKRDSRRRDAQHLPVFALHAPGLVNGVRRWLNHNLELVRHRDVLQAWLTREHYWENDDWNPRARGFDDRGDLRRALARGFVGLPAKPQPPRQHLLPHELSYRQKLRHFDKLLESSPIWKQTIELATWCSERGIQLVLATPPVHPLFMQMLPEGRRDYARFVRRLAALARSVDVPLFSPIRTGAASPHLFRDSHHLNGVGADWFARELADFLIERRLFAAEPLSQNEKPARGATGKTGFGQITLH